VKRDEVVIGGRYQTRISGQLVLVEVVREGIDYFSKRTAFVCRRKDNGRELPKMRTAAALHHTRLTQGLQGLGAGLAALGS
jgi:hypothetical protein